MEGMDPATPSKRGKETPSKRGKKQDADETPSKRGKKQDADETPSKRGKKQDADETPRSGVEKAFDLVRQLAVATKKSAPCSPPLPVIKPTCPAAPTGGSEEEGADTGSKGGDIKSSRGDSKGGDIKSSRGDSKGGDSKGGDNDSSGNSKGGDNDSSGNSKGGDNDSSGNSKGGDTKGSGDSKGGDTKGSGDSKGDDIQGGDSKGKGDAGGKEFFVGNRDWEYFVKLLGPVLIGDLRLHTYSDSTRRIFPRLLKPLMEAAGKPGEAEARQALALHLGREPGASSADMAFAIYLELHPAPHDMRILQLLHDVDTDETVDTEGQRAAFTMMFQLPTETHDTFHAFFDKEGYGVLATRMSTMHEDDIRDYAQLLRRLERMIGFEETKRMMCTYSFGLTLCGLRTAETLVISAGHEKSAIMSHILLALSARDAVHLYVSVHHLCGRHK